MEEVQTLERLPESLPQFLPEPPDALPPLDTPLTEHDERSIRDELRRQISRLEAELGRLFAAAFPRQGIEWGVAAPGSPRVLGIAELEEVRDELADRLSDARSALREHADSEEAHRQLLERMIADPAAYRGVVIPASALGQPGCGKWRSAPQAGIFGVFGKWWKVKLSSGCPLAGGDGSPRRPQESS